MNDVLAVKDNYKTRGCDGLRAVRQCKTVRFGLRFVPFEPLKRTVLHHDMGYTVNRFEKQPLTQMAYEGIMAVMILYNIGAILPCHGAWAQGVTGADTVEAVVLPVALKPHGRQSRGWRHGAGAGLAESAFSQFR